MVTVTRACRYGCRARAVDGRTMCAECLARKARAYRRRRSSGRCAQCGEPSVRAWCGLCLELRVLKGRSRDSLSRATDHS